MRKLPFLTIRSRMSRKNIPENHALATVRALAEARIRIFSSATFRNYAKKLGFEGTSTSNALSRLTKQAWIVRLRKGLYALGSSMTGQAPIHEFEIAMGIAQEGAISYWTALHFHGLTDQIPKIIYTMITQAGKVPHHQRGNYGGCEIEGVQYQFVLVNPESFFGLEKVWIGEARIVITDLEKTLIDALSKPHLCGGIDEVFHCFHQASSKIHLDKIIGYALKASGAVVKRLGWILSKLEIKESKLKKLKEFPLKSVCKLDPSGKNIGQYNFVWQVRENIYGNKI